MTTLASPAPFAAVNVGELGRVIATHAADPGAGPISIVGGKTATEVGHPLRQPAALVVSTTGLNQVVDYPSRDMTITVETGIRIDELSRVLSEQGQRLAVEIPQSDRATLGGAIACNASGPRRFGLGTLRDYVIGISGVNARGEQFKAGGRVVKNVAGYDLCKGLIGSLGTLAVITQVTLKLKPLPELTVTLWIGLPSIAAADTAVAALLQSSATPVAIEVLNATAAAEVAADLALQAPVTPAVLCVTVEGTEPVVDWQLAALQRELMSSVQGEMVVLRGASSHSLLQELTGFQVNENEAASFTASVLPSTVARFLDAGTELQASLLAHAASGVVVGHLPEQMSSQTTAATAIGKLRQLAHQGRGHLTVTDCPESWKSAIDVFGRYDGEWTLMQRLKKAMDPRDLFAPGRMFRS